MAEKMNIVGKLHQDFVVKKIKETNWKKGSASPLVVEFDTTEVCNLACPGCISEDLVSNKTSFSNERLLEIANELYVAGVKAVILIGGGEPLAHPAVGKFISFLGKHDIHIGITTNGVFIDKYIDIIAEYSNWTRISIDAATKDTFDMLRPSKNGKSEFDHIIDNMISLAKLKKGKLGFSFLIRTDADGFGIKSNIHEIYNAAILAKGIGCDYFEVKPSYSYANGQNHALIKHNEIEMKRARCEIERLDNLETEKFRIIKAINLEDSLNCVQSLQEKNYTTCPVAELRTLVSPSGVYVCPYWRGKEKYRIGDMNNVAFDELWNSDKRKEIMAQVNPKEVCKFHCLRDDSNKELIRLIENDIIDIRTLEEYDRFI